MNDNPTNDARREAVDMYWETFPPLWLRIRGFIRMAAEMVDLSVEQFNILRLIKGGVCSVSTLAVARNISRPAVSKAIDILVDKGLIDRKPDLRDRRHVYLALTELGDIRLKAMGGEINQRILQTFSKLTDSELQHLLLAMDALKRINEI